MPNITSILNDHIRRLSRREINNQTGIVRRATAQYRRDIAALKREIAALRRTVGFLEQQEKKRVASQPVPETTEGQFRFRPDGLRAHRQKLALSAKDYGKLVGVAGLTIYQWESGKTRPRQAQLAKLAAVRGLGKREALKRLELMGVSLENKRGSYDQTAEEFIQSLVKSRKATTSGQINDEWKKSGRPGKADNTLSRMVANKQLARTKLKDQRGSRYAVA